MNVSIPTLFRQYAAGASVVSVDGETVGEAFKDLVVLHPALKDQLMTESGSLHKFINVYVNDEDIRYLESLDTPVGDEDSILILPAVAGG